MSTEPIEQAPPTIAPPSSAPSTTASNPTTTNFASASLYIGDLHPSINESSLYEIFNAVGPVASIRVCRDAVTRRSLGYAYVNYHNAQDAERAIESMNFGEIKGRPCRIMWSQRDPSVRRSGVGNIFVKNLHEGIDNKQLYDTFSLFGNILSCKVVTDKETGLSKGYGYVHYETAEAAAQAIEKLDGMLIDGREVQVGVFMRRDTRPGGREGEWTNIFVKNLPFEWDDDKLKAEFEKFGEIISASISQGTRKKFPKKKPVASASEAEKKEENGQDKEGEGAANDDKKDAAAAAVVTDDEGEKKEAADPSEKKVEEIQGSLGFGFVNFATHEAALAAVNEMNEKEFSATDDDGETITKVLFVGRAQKKAERERELRMKYEAEKNDRIAKFQGVNLYVKNLDDSVTDDTLRDEFSSMGTITSARVMRDLKTGVSRGFGFVCYSTPEDATRAVNEMNGKIVCGKPIFVALAQRRDVRRAQLEAQHNQGRGGGPGGQPGMMRPMGGPMGGQYPGAVPMPMYRPGPGGMQPSYPMGPGMMVQGGRGGYNMRPGQPGPGYPGMPGAYGMMPAQPGRTGRGGPMQGRGGRGPLPARVPQGRGPMPGRAGPPNSGIKFNQQARNAQGPGMLPPQQAPQPAAPQPAPTNEQLTPAALASASPEMQKNMIGERLYPLIHQTQPELAGKITGMLLEMDNSELLHLLESPEALNAKIHEALQVLEAHNAAASK
ncbi:hypothetical protein ACHAXN_009699 [Cyclotella atomus]